MASDTFASSGKAKCKKDHPKFIEVNEACLALVLKYGSCCITIFERKHPELTSHFDRKLFQAYLSREQKRIRDRLKEQGQEHKIPENPYANGKKPSFEEATAEGTKPSATPGTQANKEQEEDDEEEEDEYFCDSEED